MKLLKVNEPTLNEVRRAVVDKVTIKIFNQIMDRVWRQVLNQGVNPVSVQIICKMDSI